ncbi:MAG: hypothetical protein DRO96_02415 [Candidatus Aenigmatarchaeota archaeon]|nr:MAG: hypothetical protein DRO96_02415 [Candidatus Aenigmarchaeota archaeon]
MIDVHCHLEYMKNAENVIKEIQKRMTAAITSCAAIKDKDITLRYAQEDKIFSCLGFHPEEVPRTSSKDIEDYIEFISLHKKDIVAVGEVGLDYYHTKKPQRDETKFVFQMFVNLANDLKLPLVVHCRDAMKDTLKILEQAKGTVVIHHFSGNDEELKCALERGYWISLGTVICNSKARQEQIPKIPLEKILLETDSPWNDPFSKGLNNKPWNIAFSADIIAKKKEVPVFQVINQTTENAKKAFGLDI